MNLVINLETATLDITCPKRGCIGHIVRVVPNPHEYVFLPKKDITLTLEDMTAVHSILQEENLQLGEGS